MVRKEVTLIIIFIIAFSVTGWSEVFLNRIESSLMYEHLDPNDIYGDWFALNVTYFREVNPTLNYHVGATVHFRDENAILFFAGIGKVWTRKLFSNFAFSAATKCNYLQKYRWDADINLKLLKNENLIATLGYAYVKSYGVHEDHIWRYGLSLYVKRFIFEFMIFDNTSNPGNLKSSTSLFSIGYGIDGWQWTYFIFNFGKQAYYVDYDVIEVSNEITLKHRHWLENDFGWFASLGFMELGNAYDKYLFQFGLFWQY